MERKGNILLIWPAFKREIPDFSGLTSIFGQSGLFLPLPLLTVAASLGSDWNFKLLDLSREIVTEMELDWADYIMISANPAQKFSVNVFLEQNKSKGKKIILGGSLPTLTPDLFDESVTIVVGEIESMIEGSKAGDRIAQVLSQDMRSGLLRPVYRAIASSSLTHFSLPRYDLCDLKEYFNFLIEFSRGNGSLNNPIRRKAVSQILRELSLLTQGGDRRTVFVADEAFFGNMDDNHSLQEVKTILDALYQWQKENHFPFDFFLECPLFLSGHPDILEKMAICGMNILLVRLDTLEQQLQSGQSTEEVLLLGLNKIRSFQRSGLGLAVILPLDKDAEKMAIFWKIFIKESAVPVVSIDLANKNSGLIIQAAELLAEFYHPTSFYNRCLKWIENWNDGHVLTGLSGSIYSNLKPLRIIRSIFYQGYRSAYRIAYFNYLIRVFRRFRHNRAKLALALYLSYLYKAFESFTSSHSDMLRKLTKETK